MGRRLHYKTETITIGVRVPTELRDHLDEAATARGVDRSTVLREILKAGWAVYRREHLIRGGIAS